jgi:hypothetical protein
MARASTVLSAIHVRLIHASVWLHRNRRDVGPSVAFERQRRIAAGGWQRPTSHVSLSGCTALIVLTPRLRDPVQRPGGFRQRTLGREIAQRDNPDKALIPVHHRETPHL